MPHQLLASFALKMVTNKKNSLLSAGLLIDVDIPGVGTATV